eukprot:CAMPEP_0204543376 /NCGR_PEP_ID=MMETSP0661-20131031/19709_1 /ASSEMBLY_ACC=CAM_ASM_000606 /TAXON_ID=109239 /ORGANISM="Alexandrium margalefi, Strain AMGDE01CS-322" /LENGTH=57 /DNA_ID=CAMNT_0051550099 /DNA_START=23 /DNA_END=193 /DNA_ORIENTATION=+
MALGGHCHLDQRRVSAGRQGSKNQASPEAWGRHSTCLHVDARTAGNTRAWSRTTSRN